MNKWIEFWIDACFYMTRWMRIYEHPMDVTMDKVVDLNSPKPIPIKKGEKNV
jgi:hypothetical protein